MYIHSHKYVLPDIHIYNYEKNNYWTFNYEFQTFSKHVIKYNL